jgi:ATP-dependent DNA helicase RecQ
MCDVCDPPVPTDGSERGLPLPQQIAPAILSAVAALPWPVGVKGLVATLRGSVDAPPSAQNSDGFGILSAAPSGKIRKWVDALLESGNLEIYENEGFRLVRVARRDGWPQLSGGDVSHSRPTSARRALLRGTVSTHTVRAEIQLSPDDQALFDRLRAWRASLAQAEGLPAYTIVQDRALRAIAVSRPRNRAELASLDGIGSAKLDRYGHEILTLVARSS